MTTSLTPSVHVFEAPQRFYGLEVGARMTVLDLDGDLLLHSPLPVDPQVLAPLGRPRWVLAPNKLHHLYAGPWIAQGLEGWAAPGLRAKRPDLDAREVAPGDQPFGEDVVLFPLTCFPFSNEVVLLHRPSRTLVVTDLVFHFPDTAPALTRAAMFCACGYPGCRTTLLERALMHREPARREIGALLDLDFDRLIMSHGTVIEQGGRQALADAFAWLLPT